MYRRIQVLSDLYRSDRPETRKEPASSRCAFCETAPVSPGIYRLETGRVDFLGPSPNQAKLLSSELHLPPSMAVLPIRTSFDEPLHPNMPHVSVVGRDSWGGAVGAVGA